MLHCHSVVAPETSLPERTAGASILSAGARSQIAGVLWTAEACSSTAEAQFSVCRSAVGKTKHCRHAHCDCRSTHLNCRNAVLHCRRAVAPNASLSERTVGACSSTAEASYRYA
ncbi:hypothetical protein AMTRI_Chr11g102070 [Amborella trichopoda]